MRLKQKATNRNRNLMEQSFPIQSINNSEDENPTFFPR